MATRLAAAIKNRMGLDAELVEGNGGILEVRADSDLVFANKGDSAEQYPGEDAIVDRLAGPGSVATDTPQEEASTSQLDAPGASCSIDMSPDVPLTQELASATGFSTFACGCATQPGPGGCRCSGP